MIAWRHRFTGAGVGKNLLLLAGFLGSGKTTLIIKLVGALSDRNLKMAMLVNEIGKWGSTGS
jgi:G3E family GTPase